MQSIGNQVLSKIHPLSKIIFKSKKQKTRYYGRIFNAGCY